MKPKEIERLEKVLRLELIDLLDLIWELAGDMEWNDLVDRSGLCYGTIRRLYDGDWVYPRFLTIQKLAYAVDLQVTASKDGIKVSLADFKAERKSKRQVAVAA